MTDAETRARKKTLQAARGRKHYEANRHKVSAQASSWRSRNPDKVGGITRRAHLKRSYGLTQEQFDAMLAAQNNSCAICGAKDPKGSGTFHVDHCHSSGSVRALLCHHCNVGLGNFNDNPARLIQAASYLTQHAQEAA